MPEFPSTGRIAIRVSAGSQLGMGHLVRCTHLARRMLARNLTPVFLIDQYTGALTAWLREFFAISLYDNVEFADELQDAQRCLGYLQAGDWVLVDDYRLSGAWEEIVRERARKIIAIDDLANRAHACDMLVDYRWCRGGDLASRYRGLLPRSCKTLLGPDYCLLAPEYQQKPPHTHAGDGFIVLLSLGGGNDAAILATMLATLAEQTRDAGMEFWAVAGALAQNREALEKLEAEYDNIKVIHGASSLVNYYRAADLFIGAAGTSIYEVNNTRLPSISFSLTENQDNARADLEDLGLYLHIDREDLNRPEALARLLLTVQKNYTRLEQLVALRKIDIDGYGCKRVLAEMLEEDPRPPKPALRENVLQTQGQGYRKELQGGFYIEEIADSELNRYLDARNLELNRKRMSCTQSVPRVEHYNWWFTHKRHIFMLVKDAQRYLYIWHQFEQFEGEEYLIGGWFVASEACSFDLTALALNWQLGWCKKYFPRATWLAIINKENRFVNLLNSLHGFKTVEENSRETRAIEHFFPAANQREFNYVACTPTAAVQEEVDAP